MQHSLTCSVSIFTGLVVPEHWPLHQRGLLLLRLTGLAQRELDPAGSLLRLALLLGCCRLLTLTLHFL